jgi:hypothetical protein
MLIHACAGRRITGVGDTRDAASTDYEKNRDAQVVLLRDEIAQLQATLLELLSEIPK